MHQQRMVCRHLGLQDLPQSMNVPFRRLESSAQCHCPCCHLVALLLFHHSSSPSAQVAAVFGEKAGSNGNSANPLINRVVQLFRVPPPPAPRLPPPASPP